MSTKVTTFALVKTKYVLDIGEMAEWSIAAVLKTVEGHTSGGSNPSLSAGEYGNSLIFNEFLLLCKFLHCYKQ